MPQPHLRSRSARRSRITLPGGRTSSHYTNMKTFKPLCPVCGKPLGGVAHTKPAKMRKLNLTKRRVWRPYGGQVCHSCLKEALERAARTF